MFDRIKGQELTDQLDSPHFTIVTVASGPVVWREVGELVR